MKQTQLKPEELARQYIDKHLASTGWKLLKEGDNVPKTGSYALPELEVNGKFADYALNSENVQNLFKNLFNFFNRIINSFLLSFFSHKAIPL